MDPNLSKYRDIYRDELLNSVVPFWVKNSLDWENGGYYTCLDRRGEVYDSDKFIWLQGRQAWMFSKLYLEVEKNPEWLKIAKNGIDFLESKAQSKDGFYFSLTETGIPLIQPYNIFSDCFACMAFAGYSKASGDSGYAAKAVKIFESILARQDNTKGRWDKSTGNRPTISFALPMILCNLSLELEGILSADKINDTIRECQLQVMDMFREAETGLIFEYRSPAGEFIDTFEGRLLNPGHGIEAMWFLLDIAERKGDKELVEKSIQSLLSILDYSWDNKHGGIFYFMDSKGAPPQQLEWDQKLWWVHIETLIALLKAYRMTNRSELWEKFELVHDYTWSHFPDPENGEWFGYLNREGNVLLDLKGGKWKGCFHVPRGLLYCWKELELIDQ